MPHALSIVTDSDGSLTSDLQEEGSPLVREDQTALRMIMAMRVIRSVAADRSHNETDLLVIETLLSNWWRDWSDVDAGAFHPFAVEVPTGAVGEVTGLGEAEVDHCLARLQARGFVQVSAAPARSGPRQGELYDLSGAFRPVLPVLEGLLLRSLTERHRSDVSWAAEQTIEIVGDDLEQLHPLAGATRIEGFRTRWAQFVEDHARRDLTALWAEDPAAVYDWLSTLADLQDEMGVLQARPCDGSLRDDLSRWTETKVVLLSRHYRTS